MALLVEEDEQPQSVFAQAFARDEYKCRYCGLSILQSFDAFAASHLDHLKPRSAGGSDSDPWNRVTSCGVCNSLKGSFDPCPGATVTAETFEQSVALAKDYILKKRKGITDTSYHRDYQYWLKKTGRGEASQETPT